MNNDPLKPQAGGGDFTLANAGVHPAVVIAVVDEGHQYNATYNNTQQKVSLGFEIEQDGERLTLWKQYTNSLGKNSNLRKDLERWMGSAMTPEQVENFTLRDVLGKSCQIQVIHKPSKDGTRTFANVDTIFTKSTEVAPSEQPFIFLSANPQENFDKLPKFIQARVQGGGQVNANDYPADNASAQQTGNQQAPAAAPAPTSNVNKIDF